MPLEELVLKLIEDQLCRIVLVGAYLLQHNLLFGLKILFAECGVEDNIGQQVKGASEIGVQNGGVEEGLLFGGVGVQVSSHILKVGEDLCGVSFAGALEDGVLNEMGDAVLLRPFVACAGVHHQPHMCYSGAYMLLYDFYAVIKPVILVGFLIHPMFLLCMCF